MGHEGNYALDEAGGRPGLRYTGKREWQRLADDSLAGRLEAVFNTVLHAVAALEAAETLPVPLIFRSDELEITVADRLLVPYARVADVQFELQAALESLFAGRKVHLERTGHDPSQLLRWRATVPEAPPAAQLVGQPAEVGVSR